MVWGDSDVAYSGSGGYTPEIDASTPEGKPIFFWQVGVWFLDLSPKFLAFCFDTSCRVAYSLVQIC